MTTLTKIKQDLQGTQTKIAKNAGTWYIFWTALGRLVAQVDRKQEASVGGSYVDQVVKLVDVYIQREASTNQGPVMVTLPNEFAEHLYVKVEAQVTIENLDKDRKAALLRSFDLGLKMLTSQQVENSGLVVPGS